MAVSDTTLSNNAAYPTNDSHSVFAGTTTLSNLLSELPIRGDTLLFGLNFKYTEVTKKGFINRIKGHQEAMDIDLSCVVFNDQLEAIETVWFKQLRDSSEAIRHQGDSLNGKDRGAAAELDRNVDVETIEIRLSRLNPEASHLALLISSYKEYPLNKVERGNLYISDDEGNEIYNSDLTLLNTDSYALCVAILSRELGEWRFTVKDLALNSSKIDDMGQQVSKELGRIYG